MSLKYLDMFISKILRSQQYTLIHSISKPPLQVAAYPNTLHLPQHSGTQKSNDPGSPPEREHKAWHLLFNAGKEVQGIKYCQPNISCTVTCYMSRF